MLPGMLATSSGYPWYIIAAIVFGVGGFGTAIWRLLKGASAMMAILKVLTGEAGGKGRREVKPLVELVDDMHTALSGAVAEQGRQGTELNRQGDVQRVQGIALGRLRVDVDAMQKNTASNGGESNSLGDRAKRSEDTLARIEAVVTPTTD